MFGPVPLEETGNRGHEGIVWVRVREKGEDREEYLRYCKGRGPETTPIKKKKKNKRKKIFQNQFGTKTKNERNFAQQGTSGRGKYTQHTHTTQEVKMKG